MNAAAATAALLAAALPVYTVLIVQDAVGTPELVRVAGELETEELALWQTEARRAREEGARVVLRRVASDLGRIRAAAVHDACNDDMRVAAERALAGAML